jgi:hypothetical protein
LFSVTTTSNSIDGFILKLSLAGNFSWVKTFGGDDVDKISNMSLDISGNIFLTGYFWGVSDFDPGPSTYTLMVFGSNQCNVFVSKLDLNGSFVWARSFIGTSFDYGSSIKVDQIGNVYSTGTFMGTTDFDPGAGTYTILANAANSGFLSKLDQAGNFVWAKSFVNSASCKGLAIDQNNNIYVPGSFVGTVDLDIGAGTQIVNTAGAADSYIMKLDPSGNFQWAGCNQGTGSDGIVDIVLDNSNNIFTTGTFFGTTDFDPSAGTYSLAASNGGAIFIQKLSPLPAGVEDISLNKNEIVAYPIPASDILYLSNSSKNSSFILLNALGEIILSGNTEPEVNLSQFSKGVYFLKVTSENSQRTFKIIKE